MFSEVAVEAVGSAAVATLVVLTLFATVNCIAFACGFAL
jgi:hypothetical protein